MESELGLVLNGVEIFLLVFARMTGLFVIAPIFGRRNIPAYFKIGFSFMLALILTNTLKMELPDYSENIFGYSALIFKEFATGLVIGYASYLIFTAVYLAGQIIDMQVGFGLVNVIDPLSNIQVPVTSNFYFILCMLIFLTVDVHHVLIKALFESYKVISPGGAVFGTQLIDELARLMASVFLLAFKISAPVVATVLIADVALGVLMKTVPQLNVFVVGIPLKILLGIVVMWLTIPAFVMVTEILLRGMDVETANLIGYMARR